MIQQLNTNNVITSLILGLFFLCFVYNYITPFWSVDYGQLKDRFFYISRICNSLKFSLTEIQKLENVVTICRYKLELLQKAILLLQEKTDDNYKNYIYYCKIEPSSYSEYVSITVLRENYFQNYKRALMQYNDIVDYHNVLVIDYEANLLILQQLLSQI